MTFRKTLQQVVEHGGLAKICTCLHTSYYQDDNKPFKQVMSNYKRVINELLGLQENITNTNYSIYLSGGVDDSDPDDPFTFVDVCLYDEDKDAKFAIDLEDWQDIIDMNIHCAEGFDVHDTLAHILWEITFWGMSAASLSESKRELIRTSQESVDEAISIFPFLSGELDK